MRDLSPRPAIHIRFNFNLDTGEIDFIIDDGSPDRSENYHNEVARAIASFLSRNPDIHDAGPIHYHLERQLAELVAYERNEGGGERSRRLDVVSQSPTLQNSQRAASVSELSMPVVSHLRTLPFCHVAAPDFPRARIANWFQGAAAAGWPLPLALAHDLGILLSQPGHRLTLAKPSHLPFDEDTSAYLAALQRIAGSPLVRDLASWRPPLSDIAISIILARLVEGLDLPDVYLPPPGTGG